MKMIIAQMQKGETMTKQEKIIVSAYTGVLMCDFSDMQAYIQEKLGRPVFTHELADVSMQETIVQAVKGDFLAICNDTADVVEVIRCKDCKHYDGRPCGIVNWYNTADDFCSRAERRTDGTD